ncbi:MAG: hypothetical protein AB1847_17855 [bacterium]
MKCLYAKALVVLLGGLLILGCIGCGGSNDSNFTIAGDDGNIIDGNTVDGSSTDGKPLGDPYSIEFVSATPSTLALKDTGGPHRSEIAILVFKVVDEYGHPLPGQAVKFKLSTEIGDLSLSDPNAVSNSEGLVQVTVKAGNVPTHIRVQATLVANSSITIASDELAVTTGLPDQNSISLSAETPNSEAWNYNNVEVPIIFQASDHFNNFVPDGTVVYFTTEGGSIRGSDVLKDGVCEVPWRSCDPRPADGRVTILAFCIGEESFIDYNTNGFFDEGDLFDHSTDLAEPFRDDNENGVHDPGEEYWDYNDNGRFDGVPNGIYNGTLCSDTAKALGLCTEQLVYNQASLVLTMSGSFADITLSPESVDLREKSGEMVFITIADVNNNPMPAGTTVSVTTTNGKIVGDSSFKVPCTYRPGPLSFTVFIEPSPDDDKTYGILTVEVTTPKGNKTTQTTMVIDDDKGTSSGSGNIDIGPVGDPYSIEFISATPSTLALKDTGGPHRSEVSILVFKVVDEYGHPTPNQAVKFKLSTEIGGLSLSDPNAVSNPEGLVQVTVKAGNVPTHIRVRATLVADSSITIVSDELAVTTGLPDQNSISLSAKTLNPEAWNYNNEEVPIIFQASDHFNNFVPDGTVVYFTTEGGSIRGYDIVKDGVCTVPWRSSEPRPADGRVTILAFCIGEESFIDYNTNGFFDEGDLFDYSTDLAEPFRDDNENGTRDPGEEYWDYNNNGQFDGEPNGIYNGVLCSDTAKAMGLCTEQLVYNQASLVLTMSGSFADITLSPESVDLRGKSGEAVLISIADVNNNPMPSDTTVKVETTNGKIIGESTFKVPCTSCPGPLSFSIFIEPSPDDDKTYGILTVEVTTPKGNKTTEAITVVDDDQGTSSGGGDIDIEPAGEPASIEFVSAAPSTIALKGTGGPHRSEVSTLVFKLVDAVGRPTPNQAVKFKLSTEIGGLSLSDPNAVSNPEGLVQVTVKSGTMPTHIRVQATLVSDPSVITVSDELAITSGLPDQNSISIGPETFNPEAWNHNNVVVPITFQASDHFNNFVPDGTVVYFTAEGGSIRSSDVVKDGVCTVPWRSSDPRPKDGIVTIMAFCIGEESFTNNNASGLFEAGDWFDPNTDMAEPFRDDNRNGIRDPGEEYWDYNNNGQFDSEPNGIYNGTLCSDAAQASGICTRELIYNQASTVLLMSGSFAQITFSPESIDFRGKNSETVLISVADVNNNPMPEGTTVKVETTNGKIIGESSFKVPCTGRPGPISYPIQIESTPGDGKDSGILTVKVTTPKGFESTAATSVLDNYAPLGEPCSIEFISATPSTIALKGTGGPHRSEVSILVFKVVDEYGNPFPAQAVRFQLSTEIGGLSLSDPNAVSNSGGLVQVTVKAGTISTHIRVQAILVSNPSITIVSDELAITTGLPDQDSVSVSAETGNPEAWNYENVEVPITFRAADHFNNFVPDGTVVYFTTEGGSIQGSSVVKNGLCTVPWLSGPPRPDNGLVTILAMCIGEESFTNYNASGLFDEGDQFNQRTDLAEPFLDKNYDGIRDPDEEYWDYNHNGHFDGESNGIYNGTLCSDAVEALDLCTKELVYVQDSIQIIMSGSEAYITFWPESLDFRSTHDNYQSVSITIADLHNNPMPAGTTVSMETTNGTIVGPKNFRLPNTCDPKPFTYSVIIQPTKDDVTWGMFTVEVTTPHGVTSVDGIAVQDDPKESDPNRIENDPNQIESDPNQTP